MKQLYLEAGRVLTTHGLKGEIKFEYWADSAAHFKKGLTLYRKPDGTDALNILSVRVQGRFLLLTFAGVSDIDAAALLRGKTLYIARKSLGLPEDTVFWADLIGESVCDAESGVCYGHIREIRNQGAGDLWEIESPDGKRVLFPAVPVFIETLTVNGATIRPPEGLF